MEVPRSALCSLLLVVRLKKLISERFLGEDYSGGSFREHFLGNGRMRGGRCACRLLCVTRFVCCLYLQDRLYRPNTHAMLVTSGVSWAAHSVLVEGSGLDEHQIYTRHSGNLSPRRLGWRQRSHRTSTPCSSLRIYPSPAAEPPSPINPPRYSALPTYCYETRWRKTAVANSCRTRR